MDAAQNALSGLLVVLVIALGIGLAIWSWKVESRRRQALAAFCAEHGLSFSPGRDSALSETFQFVSEIANGSNRYAENVIQGVLDGHEIIVFDHHYETKSRSNGRTSTTHHRHCVFALRLPTAFPGLRIAPEDILSKVAQAFGYDDIDFESHEFSRAFCVRSKDRKFAYNFCNPAMMEFLLSRRTMRLSLDLDLLAIVHGGRLAPDSMERRSRDLFAVRERLPEYLFTA